MINDLILNKTSDNIKIFILTMISSFDHDKNSDCQKSVILSKKFIVTEISFLTNVHISLVVITDVHNYVFL